MGVLRPELARFSGVSAREVRRTYYLALVRTHTRHVQHLPHRGFRHANLACNVTILLAFCRANDNVSAYRLSDYLAGSSSILLVPFTFAQPFGHLRRQLRGQTTANVRGAVILRGRTGNDINRFVWIENVLYTLRVNVVASTHRQGEIRAHVSDTLHGMEITGTHYEPRLIKNRLSDVAQNAACGDSCA